MVLLHARVNYSLVPLVLGQGSDRYGGYDASAGKFTGRPRTDGSGATARALGVIAPSSWCDPASHCHECAPGLFADVFERDACDGLLIPYAATEERLRLFDFIPIDFGAPRAFLVYTPAEALVTSVWVALVCSIVPLAKADNRVVAFVAADNASLCVQKSCLPP